MDELFEEVLRVMPKAADRLERIVGAAALFVL
jgi:hypothetical protein